MGSTIARARMDEVETVLPIASGHGITWYSEPESFRYLDASELVIARSELPKCIVGVMCVTNHVNTGLNWTLIDTLINSCRNNCEMGETRAGALAEIVLVLSGHITSSEAFDYWIRPFAGPALISVILCDLWRLVCEYLLPKCHPSCFFFPRQASFLQRRGVSRFYNSDYRGALCDFSTALRLNASHLNHINLSLALAECGQHTEALAQLKDCPDEGYVPTNSETKENKFLALAARGIAWAGAFCDYEYALNLLRVARRNVQHPKQQAYCHRHILRIELEKETSHIIEQANKIRKENTLNLVLSWSTPEVVGWLRGIGPAFEQYAPSFLLNGVTGASLCLCTDEMLRSTLGVHDAFHRLRIRTGIHNYAPP
jgi:SAM domain (Sterile alpha motif)